MIPGTDEMTLVSGAEAVVEGLERNGVDLIFGIPGTHTLPIYRHLPRSGIRHITPRHEQACGYAADGYARASGRPGVCLLTTGPGVINAATSAATAYADSVPLLIISSAVPSAIEGEDSGFLHESRDQRGALEGLVSKSYYPRSAGEIAAAIDEAFHGFANRRPRPVHIGIPLDAMEDLGDARAPSFQSSASEPGPQVDPASIREAAELLDAAGSVAVVAGGGARHAQLEVTALAERLQAPVLTTANGKGVLDEDHRLSLGPSLRLPAARRWLSSCDAVLAVGTELAESDLWGPPLELGGSLVRVDIDPRQLDKNAAARIHLLGDAGPALAALLAEIPERRRAEPDVTGLAATIRREATVDGEPWIPLSRALSRTLVNGGVLCADSAMASYFGAVHFVHLDSPSRFLYPTGYATLGYALPAAIGAKLARPDLAVVALIGDGGLMFTVSELATAAELGLPLPVLVVSNGGYGEIHRQMREREIEPLGVELDTPDLPLLAQSMGCRGLRIRDEAELAPQLEIALRQPGPTLIELVAPPAWAKSPRKQMPARHEEE